ncbi:MAG TPA: class I SAM-dependent methyltransferase [Bacteroidia bacterium]|nr:class I SAM-dependent methyltransferase [Bacteroidia bacterium]
MGVTFKRKKKKNLLLSLIYRLNKIPILSKKKKFELLLNLEWIFERLVHEMSFDLYNETKHPLRIYTNAFLFNFIKPEDSVLDLGCKYGEISAAIAEKVKRVVGVDFDKIAIDKANSSYKRNNLSFVTGDALIYLKNNTEKFNVLILSHILEHIEEPKKMLLDFKPFVQYMFIELPDFDKTYLNHYRKDFNCELIYSDPDHIFEFDRIELINLIKDCELEILSSEYRFGVQRYWLKT